jgi:chloride channel protein, CIC family
VVKAVASAVCIGAGGSVGREGPIVQIGPALASSLGQRVKMPENRLRILVACGAGGGIAATFNAPVTGVFFDVEIILREFSINALFTVMLAAMIADITAIPFLGDKPFLSGFPPGIEMHHARDYLLIAVLAVVAALMGLAFKAVLYATEDLCDRVWKGRPEWARPAAGGVALGLLLLAIPQMYGVGYPVMYKATAGQYALWFLVVLAFAKIAACSLTIGIGGSGGVFAPSLFIGVTSGMAFGDVVHHIFGAAAGQPALYAVVAMGAVFASAALAPLTSLASVVEMTGDFALTLPVMLAVAIASTISRALSYGTRYPAGSPRPTCSAASPARSPPPTRPRPGPLPTGTTPTRARSRATRRPAARLPVHRDRRHRRLARRRAHPRRRHLAAGQHPGDRPARPSAPPAPARPHPGPRRPHQPAHRGARRLTSAPSGGGRSHPAVQRREP